MAKPIELTERDIARFWSQVQQSDCCWEWTGWIYKGETRGYGGFEGGRLTLIDKEIHHIDGDPRNNDLSNLEVREP